MVPPPLLRAVQCHCHHKWHGEWRWQAPRCCGALPSIGIGSVAAAWGWSVGRGNGDADWEWEMEVREMPFRSFDADAALPAAYWRGTSEVLCKMCGVPSFLPWRALFSCTEGRGGRGTRERSVTQTVQTPFTRQSRWSRRAIGPTHAEKYSRFLPCGLRTSNWVRSDG